LQAGIYRRIVEQLNIKTHGRLDRFRYTIWIAISSLTTMGIGRWLKSSRQVCVEQMPPSGVRLKCRYFAHSALNEKPNSAA